MLVTQTVKIKWSNTNKNHYIDQGYAFTKIKNEFEVKVEDLNFGSSISVEFICDYCNGKNQKDEKNKFKLYRHYINSKKTTNKDCCNHPECRGLKISESRSLKEIKKESILAEKFPKLINQWSDRNSKTPYEHSFGEATIVWWNCPDCKSEYDMRICHRTNQNLNCPFCSGQRVNHTNSITTTCPQLVLEWNFDLNVDISPNDVTKGSSKFVWWKCESGHEWKDSVTHRTSSGRKCPYCFGRKTSDENSLKVTHPDLVKEIHRTLNDDFDPSKVKHGSNIKLWWICEKGHKWKVSICDRTAYKTGCPYCSNKKVCNENCLQTLNPELAKEWDYNLNKLSPRNVTEKSKKKVWWKCKACNHSWKATILNRSYGNGCPICNESKGEKKIRKWLKDNKIEFEDQKIFNKLIGVGGGGLAFDFYIKNRNVLIEYDGEYHYMAIKLYKDEPIELAEERLRKQQYHDNLKTAYAEKQELKLIRISYLDYVKVEEILKANLLSN